VIDRKTTRDVTFASGIQRREMIKDKDRKRQEAAAADMTSRPKNTGAVGSAMLGKA